MALTKEDHDAVAAAIRDAEKRTCGQLVCVLAHASSAYAHVPILWSSLLALFTPWPLIYFTQLSVQRIFLAQLIVFLVTALAFSWGPCVSCWYRAPCSAPAPTVPPSNSSFCAGLAAHATAAAY